jgi:carbonic anhydrase/acetyltransferase-like protein (isoleucine patch superfamily)
MIYSYKGIKPVVHPTAYVHPQATVTGNVIIGKDVYIGPGAAIRGDFGQIIIEDGCNVQENCTIHMFPGVTVRLREGAHIGHGAVIHGAEIGRNCLVGMNAVVMDDVVVGDESIVGALSFVKAKEVIPPRSVVAGNPAKVVKAVSNNLLEWKTAGTRIYQQLAREAPTDIALCEPLREVGEQGAIPALDYSIWKDTALQGDDVRIIFLKQALMEHLRQLQPNTEPLFGKMNVHQMIEHLAYAFRQASGLIPLPAENNEDTTSKMYAFLMSNKPFRANTPNRYLPDTPLPAVHANSTASLIDLQHAMDGFFDTFRNNPTLIIQNPFFGRLNFNDSLQLLYKHTRHHLTQFGIEF